MMITDFLKEQLDKRAEDSKKWRATMIASKGIAGFFVIGAALITLQPAVASQLATLVQFIVTAWGGVFALYLGATGAVDFKTTAALQTTQTDERIERTDRMITEKYDPQVEKAFAERFAADPSYRPPLTVPDQKEIPFR